MMKPSFEVFMTCLWLKQKIPYEKEIALRYKLFVNCSHYLHCLHCLHCFHCLHCLQWLLTLFILLTAPCMPLYEVREGLNVMGMGWWDFDAKCWVMNEVFKWILLILLWLLEYLWFQKLFHYCSFSPACALRAPGLLLTEGAPKVRWEKTFWRVSRFFYENSCNSEAKSQKLIWRLEMDHLTEGYKVQTGHR